jgi:hypothetical protein
VSTEDGGDGARAEEGGGGLGSRDAVVYMCYMVRVGLGHIVALHYGSTT